MLSWSACGRAAKIRDDILREFDTPGLSQSLEDNPDSDLFTHEATRRLCGFNEKNGEQTLSQSSLLYTFKTDPSDRVLL